MYCSLKVNHVDEYEETHLDWAPNIFKSMNTVQQMSLYLQQSTKETCYKKNTIETGIKLELLLCYKFTIIESWRFQ